ncbi:DUF6325 family protein [Nakamurella multipartita]|uniref:DUF6325 family protein n=1 Tax=Nakamurella multipartita TaxID=53461 RepID=UPI00019E8BDB|nr:DUF6325 family protein [Nakamurella multipartita]
MSATEVDVLGPVEFAVVEFPAGVVSGSGFAQLLELADSGVIRILDLEFVRRTADGAVVPVEVADLTVGPGVDLSPFVGASSGLVDTTDLATLGDSIGVGSVAAVLVYEEQVLIPVVAAWHAAGGRLALVGHLEPTDLDEALDATEPAKAGV